MDNNLLRTAFRFCSALEQMNESLARLNETMKSADELANQRDEERERFELLMLRSYDLSSESPPSP